MFKRLTHRLASTLTGVALGALAVGAIALAQGPGHQSHQANGGASRPAPPSAAVRGVLDAVHKAVSQQAPSIAKPILDQGVAKGTITQAQEDSFLQRLSTPPPAPGSGPPAHQKPPAGATPPSAAVRALFDQVGAAVAKQAPTIAKPILDQAVSKGTITQAQADQISQRLSDPHMGPPGCGPGGPGGPGGPPPPPPASAGSGAQSGSSS